MDRELIQTRFARRCGLTAAAVTLLIGAAPISDAQYPVGVRIVIAATVVPVAVIFAAGARSGVFVSDAGMKVRNYFDVRTFRWSEVESITLSRGRAGTLLLASGEKIRLEGLATASFAGAKRMAQDNELIAALNELISSRRMEAV
ncbi:MAG TPA: PH domain-containing protein [Mycobacteriales bacterium]|nr:PH domain-containing protein [Mycobacteriales bacterium]